MALPPMVVVVRLGTSESEARGTLLVPTTRTDGLHAIEASKPIIDEAPDIKAVSVTEILEESC